MEEGTSSALNQVPPMEFGVPDVPPLEQLQTTDEVFPQVSVNPVDPYAIGLTDANPFTMDEGFNPMDQGFPEDILTQDQIQMIHDDDVGFNLLNLDFSVDFRYQDHLQMIQRELVGFNCLNPRFVNEFQTQQSLPITDNNDLVVNPVSTSGVQEQGQNQSQDPNEGVGGSHSSPQATLNMEMISQYFHLPYVQAAEALSVSTWTLRKRYREEGLKEWPYHKLKSLQTYINNAKELGDSGAPGGERLKEKLQWLENRKKEILESPNLPLGIDLRWLKSSSDSARVHRKRKIEKAAATSSQLSIQTQQQPVLQGPATSSSNLVGQQVTQHDEGDVIDDLLDNYMLFFPDDPQSSPSLGLFGV